MLVKVILFAAAKDIAGQDRLELSMDDSATLGDLKSRLVEQFPGLHEIAYKSSFAVDQEYSSDTKQLHDGAEVGFIPPVSGG